MRRDKVWILVTSLAVFLGAPLFVFAVYLPNFMTGHTSLAGVPRGRSTLPVLPPTGRLVVIIVDGLGYDVGSSMPEFAELRSRGVVRPLDVPFPSFTSPALAAFITGLAPRDSGVRLNGAPTPAIASLDTLTAVALDASRRLTFYDDGWEPFAELLAAPEDRVIHGELATAFAPYLERGFVEPNRGDIAVAYFLDVDTEGHKHGAASPEYHDASLRAARAVMRHVVALDADRDALVVLSDHGHLPDGGHGGVEPSMRKAFFAAVGPDIARGGVLASRPVEDVAPTLAMLAGLTPPAANLGRPMLDILDVDGRERARRLAAPFDQSARFLCAAVGDRCAGVPALAARMVDGDSDATDPALALLDALVAAREDALAMRASRARWLRIGGLLIALAALGFAVRRRVVLSPIDVAAPVVLVVVAAAILAIDGYRVTFSKMPGRDVFIIDATVAYLSGAAAACVLGFLSRRAPNSAWMLLVGTVVPFAALVAYVGIDAAFVVPPHAGLLVLLGAPALPAAALAAMVLGLFSSAEQAREQ